MLVDICKIITNYTGLRNGLGKVTIYISVIFTLKYLLCDVLFIFLNYKRFSITLDWHYIKVISSYWTRDPFKIYFIFLT